MFPTIINVILFIGYVQIISGKTILQWNIDAPYKYDGFIYTDSRVVVTNPLIQIRIINNEEICNFYLNSTDPTAGIYVPFRAVVKSAYLGLGELQLKSNISLTEWKNTEIKLSIMAEGCHDPESWSVPATITITVLDPPGPIWTEPSYRAVINDDTPIGTTILKVTALPPKWLNIENKICQYLIKAAGKLPFQIDGEGTIRTTKNLTSFNGQSWTLIVVAEDCSQPIHRQSQINVTVLVNPLCKSHWTGFYPIEYWPGSGVQHISNQPKLILCQWTQHGDTKPVKHCTINETLRLTTSVELKSQLVTSAKRNCKLDFQSLRLQRKVCGISDSKIRDLLTKLNRQRTGVLLFPIQGNIFPAISTPIEDDFSFYFWMKRNPLIGSSEEYIMCQIDEVGNNIFSVSIRKCVLRIRLRSYNSRNHNMAVPLIPTMWTFSRPQLCDTKWHHITILASRMSVNRHHPEMRVFFDGVVLEHKHNNPQVQRNSPLQAILSNMTDIYLGQCPKTENTEFKGLLAGVIITPATVLKSSTTRCLTTCSGRLFFSSMNRMNAGMSVSLNSQLQMIIINGHSIDEVTRLLKDVAYVELTWDPTVLRREIVVETEMSCGTERFRIPSINITVRMGIQKSNLTNNDVTSLIVLFSPVTNIIIPDSTQVNSEFGTGLSVFANTTLELSGIPQSTNPHSDDVLSTISKCVVTILPRLSHAEYIDWPQHLIDAVSSEKFYIKVTNNSRRLVFQGVHNQQIYQYVIQHLRYFGSITDNSHIKVGRTFKLQCFSQIAQSTVNSNVVVVKVTIWNNNYHRRHPTTSEMSTPVDLTTDDTILWNYLIHNLTVMRHYLPLNSQSNVAHISETAASQRRSLNVIYNLILCMGLLMLILVSVMLVRRYWRKPMSSTCLVPFMVLGLVSFPLKIIKNKIRPCPSVKVELSKEMANGAYKRRRDISMEMQWDDAELTSSVGCNIIANPMYETSVADIDDIILNKDVPPTCERDEDEDEECATDDDGCGDFIDLYFERNSTTEKSKRK